MSSTSDESTKPATPEEVARALLWLQSIGYQPRRTHIRKVNFEAYVGSANVFLGGIPPLDRVAISLWTVLMRAVLMEEIDPIEDNPDKTKLVVVNLPRLDNMPLFYSIAKRVLVDETALHERYKSANMTTGLVSQEVLPAHESLRPLTNNMNTMFANANRMIKQFLVFAGRAVDIAAIAIIASIRSEPSTELKYNIMVGCVIANLVLVAHGLVPIRPHTWITVEFQTIASTFAADHRTSKDLSVIRFTEFADYLRGIISSTEPSCHACGISASDLAKATPEGQPAQLIKICGGCRFVHYCTATCQESDWKKHHKAFCNANRIAAAPE
jgi:hypothetical protein